MGEKQAAYRRRLRAAGLCARCPTPAAPGRTLCAHHLQLAADYTRAYRKRLQS